MTINYVAESAEGSILVAQLVSRYFRPGGIVKGFVRLVSKLDTPDAYSEIAYVVAQVHGHVTVNSNLLTLPVVHVQSTGSTSHNEQEKLECNPGDNAALFDKTGVGLPDVRKFTGDTGTCIFYSAPSVLFSDINIAQTQSKVDAASQQVKGVIGPVSVAEAAHEETIERCTREFAFALPQRICPTFCGSSARVLYMISITVQCAMAGSKPVSVHLPFEVYGSEYFFQASTVASANHIAASQHENDGDTLPEDKSAKPAAPKQHNVGGTTRVGRLASEAPVPVGVRKGNEIAFELRPLLIHGRVETDLMQRAQTSIFTIGKDKSHLVRFVLTKQFYQPGEVLLGIFDFTHASIPCYEVSATLCLEETLSSMALDPDRVVQSKIFGTFREHTLGVLHTNAQFSIPHDALPTIKTDLVRFQWLLRFEFSAGTPSALLTDSSIGAARQRQSFQWHVPIVVQPGLITEYRSHANVPHKLYSGSIRVVSLSGISSS
ncbi:unnamed protein product [Peronospora belbahrii]|uniref:Rgp1 n=1 Tax=Peronospora belbahrii TaxID=622444 RepID=A0AAU9KQW1_9STRA|nr:unnamed protein product [Peronospora belbahrii]CAH0520733.1 unnamed protein product [Peronospora belbahrii]